MNLDTRIAFLERKLEDTSLSADARSETLELLRWYERQREEGKPRSGFEVYDHERSGS